ncbi:MAG TPA: hypothetical protein VF584_12255 [Longimicrobium sp.]|jgi:hypothetical protein
MTDTELAQALHDAWHSDREHVERIVLAAAVIATALERAGMQATLVGGAAIEFHAPSAYATADLDFVVEGRNRAAVNEVLTALGMRQQGRHWVRGDLFVEVPSSLPERAGGHVPDRSVHLARDPQRIRTRGSHIGYRWWRYAGYGLQALDMIDAFSSELDEAALRAHLRKEGAEDTYDLLRRVSASGIRPTLEELDALWQREYR